MIESLLGGLLIGAAVSLLMVMSGRIAGISGIAYGTLWGAVADRSWRALFLVGLVGGAWIAALLGVATPLVALPTGVGPLLVLTGAGLLVGVGTRIGNGCTSGHGVCGLARFSPRSLAATGLFMLIGVATATLLRPLLLGAAS